MKAENVAPLLRAWLLVLVVLVGGAAACTQLKPSFNDSDASGATAVDEGMDASDGEGLVLADGGEDGAWVPVGSAPGGDAPDSGGDGGELETCSEPGALRCAGSGRQSCVNGLWSPTAPCQSGQVCSAQRETLGMCLDVAAVCKGGAGQWQCDAKGVLFECSAEGASKSATDCASARLCELGRATGKCATCVPGTHRCSDRQLERCNDAGTGYTTVMTCDTAALCSAGAGACTTATCLSGRFNCQGDVLRRCNANQSGWDPVMTCGAGLCDEVGGQCDVCTPGNKACNMGAARTCDAAGQGFTSVLCAGMTSVCVGNGQCVQCDSDDDCPDPGTCRTRHCNLGTGSCQPQLATTRTTCAGGLCNAAGDCVQCLSATMDCPAETNPCRMATCNGTCGSANRTASCALTGGGSGVCSAGSCVECASGSDCPSGRPYCVLNQCRPCNGRCAVGGNCSRADDCSSNICTAGTCRPSCSGSCGIGASCSVDSDCGSNNQCVNNGCVDCASDGNCPASAPYCSSNVCRQCRSSNSALCAPGQECVGADCRTLIPSCQNDGNCSATAPNSGCRNNLCQYSGQGSPPYTCPTPASGWSYLGYVNMVDIYTHNAGIPMCLLLCPFSQCPRGYTCSTRTHTNLSDNSSSSVRVCWPDHFR